jgi:plastocyanin
MGGRQLATTTAVLALAAACGGGGGGGGPTGPTPAQVVTVTVKEFTFEPKSVRVNPGDTVRWVMQGTDPTHTVSERNGVFDSGAVFTAAGASFERRFDTAGRTYEYWCSAHRDCCQMQGSVRVGQDAPTPNPGY